MSRQRWLLGQKHMLLRSSWVDKTTPWWIPYEMTTTNLSVKKEMPKVPTRVNYVGPKPISFEALFDLSFLFNTIHLILSLCLFSVHSRISLNMRRPIKESDHIRPTYPPLPWIAAGLTLWNWQSLDFYSLQCNQAHQSSRKAGCSQLHRLPTSCLVCSYSYRTPFLIRRSDSRLTLINNSHVMCVVAL